MKRSVIHKLMDITPSPYDPCCQYDDDLAQKLIELGEEIELHQNDEDDTQDIELMKLLVEALALIARWLEGLDDVQHNFPKRLKSESPDDFYRRVALTFQNLKFTDPGREITALADLAEVPFTTAVNWVRKARARGFLELSQRQIARRSAP